MIEDDIPTSDDFGRTYMVTKGKIQSENTDLLPLETLVQLADIDSEKIQQLQFERKEIAQNMGEAISIAEISTSFRIPLITAQVLITDMEYEGILEAAEVVETINIETLQMIRQHITSL